MHIWEADFYRRPLQDERGRSLWELLICDPKGDFRFQAFCPQPDVNAEWVIHQLQQAIAQAKQPDQLRVFRPQALSLLELAAKSLAISVEPTRHTPTLKRWLEQRAQQYPELSNYTHQPYKPLDLDRPSPIPLSESLWGDQWRFATLSAADVATAFTGRMLPILEMPERLLPINLGIASTTLVPGVVIDGGRRAMPLARWLKQVGAISLTYSPGAPSGLILDAGLVDRWVVATFEDPEVIQAAQTYEERKQASQGLHFLLVQPDDAGMTYTGFWLLNANDS